MGSPTCYACYGKEMLGWIRETMATQESTPKGGRFFASNSIVIGNGPSTCSDPVHSVRGLLNQSTRRLGPHPLGFPHTMLNVKKVKDNMHLAFIEKLFTNREIGTSVQTRYLHFKGMSYENENYLRDISYVQLWKALARFRCGNT
jgi:hypothetical protein